MTQFLDEDRSFGRCLGDDKIFFMQDGLNFGSDKKVIPGSKNSGSVQSVEKSDEAPAPQLAYADMHVQALKRELKATYMRLEAADIEFEPVEEGKGINARIVEFLTAYN